MSVRPCKAAGLPPRKFLAASARVAFAALAVLAAAPEANAVVKGRASALDSFTVRVVGRFYCSGAAIDRTLVVTAGHCANRGMRVVAAGRSLGIAAISRRATLSDGRVVTVSGDAAILKLAGPLPSAITPPPLGGGESGDFTIAGYGTTSERWRGAFGRLHEARLVAAEPFALVDPERSGAIGASACFGDSGGPVLRGPALVGVITRAAHPSPRIACGHLTRWAPVRVAAADIADSTAAVAGRPVEADAPRKPARRKTVRPVAQHYWNPFARWTAR
jgi:hypothetical protein